MFVSSGYLGSGFLGLRAVAFSPGKLFHIDFGYILGRDPKPLPPPMKLSKEMVEGMGGMQSEQYQEFRKQCYTAFLHLRRSDTDTDLIAANSCCRKPAVWALNNLFDSFKLVTVE